MRQTRLVASLIVVAAFAAFAGCGKHATQPGPGPAATGVPVLVASQPPARSTLVLYDSAIWGQFDRDLDSTTVNAQSVFLKLDGQRVPCTVTYEKAARKVHLSTGATLVLQRTYTVEFTPTVRSAEGVPLQRNVFFQFTTNSLRRMVYDSPVKGALAGPLTMLAWGGSQGPVNGVSFEVYAGLDSVLVEQRLVTPLQGNVFTRLLPSVAWPRGSRVYWTVTSVNLDTQERMDGPMTWFEVIGPNVTEETVLIRARDHGSKLSTNTTQLCSSQDLPSGPSYNAAMHWNLNAIPADAWVVGATVGLAAKTNNAFQSTQPVLTMAQTEWNACVINTPGPPYPEVNGLLAAGTSVDTIRVDFTSDRLGAFFDAQLRRDIYTHGTLVRSLTNVFYWSPLSGDPAKLPFATIRYVRPGPRPAR